MKKTSLICLILCVSASLAFAAGPKSYQVTGPVLSITDDVIVVQKGNDKWEIAKDKAAKITGDLKVGAKVTIHYTMKADAIEVKEAAKKAAEPGKAEKKK